MTTGAILFTDMVDSTALRSRLGEARADLLRKHHDDLLGEAIAAHHGIVLRWTGDGVKAGFETSSDAIGAAVAIQRGVVAYGASAGAVAAFQLRIGISAGEITVDEAGDHHGLAVVEAARLEPLARPGETLVTEVVRLLGGRRANVMFEHVGERTLKGIEEPVSVFRLVDLTADSVVAMPRFLAMEYRLPMVGRAAQLQQFSSSWDEARLGSTGVLLVRGPAGMGKTRFTSACAALAHERGAIVLGGACSSDLGIPYEPFAMALGALRSLDGPREPTSGSGAGPLARLFPGAADAAGSELSSASRIDLFEAVGAMLRRLATTAPVLLVLDDLHWADEPTIQLLRHLVRNTVGQRLLFVATFRDGELVQNDPLRQLVGELHDAPTVESIDLARLTESEVAELVVSVDASAPIGRIAEAAQLVHGESSGNPFFAAELVQHLATTGQLVAPASQGPAGLSVPGSVQEAVLQRLARQPAGTHELLALAAVIGPSFHLDLLAAVSGRSADDVLDTLEAVERAGVIAEVGVDLFAFDHAIVRNALLDQMSGTRRARAHRKVAEALEAQGGEQFDELEGHWRLGGDESRSTRYLARSARRDMAALAFESARDRFQRVIDQQSRDPHADLSERAEAWLGLGSALRAIGDVGFTQAVIRGGRLARTAKDTALMALAGSLSSWFDGMIVWFFTAEAQDREVIELCEDALSVIDVSDPMRVRVLAALASHLTFELDTEPRRRLIDEARRLVSGHDDPALSALVLQAEFTCLWNPSTLERREQISRDLGRLGRGTGDPQIAFLSGFFAAYCRVERADFPGARAALVELQPLADACQHSSCNFLVERLMLTIDLARSVPDAQAQVDSFHARYEPTQMDAASTWTLQTGLLAWQAGTLGALASTMSAMTAGAQSRLWTAAQGMAMLFAGDEARAAEALEAATDLPHNYFWLAGMQAHAEVAAGLGRRDHCRRMFEELAPYRGRVGVTGGGSGCIALASRTVGMLALALGDLETAIADLADAVAQADRADFPFEGVMARRHLATALRAADRADEAVPLLHDALATAASRGFAREQGLLTALLDGSR